MKRYKLTHGYLSLPPRGGITVSGHAVSNFDVRVALDEDFATANGYYPMAADQAKEPMPREGYRTEILWDLVDGLWRCRFVQTPYAEEPLP